MVAYFLSHVRAGFVYIRSTLYIRTMKVSKFYAVGLLYWREAILLAALLYYALGKAKRGLFFFKALVWLTSNDFISRNFSLFGQLGKKFLIYTRRKVLSINSK